MVMLRPALVLLLVVLMLTPQEGEGLPRRRRSRRNTNNIIKLLRDLVIIYRSVGKREVSTLFDVDEDDQLLEEFMQTSMNKRDGLVDRDELLATATNAAQEEQQPLSVWADADGGSYS
ncbi:uncharacterized protein [Haliotis asinina]|uniref:uncharacterized protein n=1 Tax=Haliotis asinina TaxID=109174 RepID=UPI0035318D03